jgi:integrase
MIDDFTLENSINEWIDNNYPNANKTSKSILIKVLSDIYNNIQINGKTCDINELKLIYQINPKLVETSFYEVFKKLRTTMSDSTIRNMTCISKKALEIMGIDRNKLVVFSTIKTVEKKNNIDIPDTLKQNENMEKFITERFNECKYTTGCKSDITKKTMLRYWVNIMKCFGDLKYLNPYELDLSLDNVLETTKEVINSEYYIIYLHHLFYKLTDEWDIKISYIKEKLFFEKEAEKNKDGDKDFLSPKQQEDIWHACENTMEKLVIALLFTTGLRVGGLCNIKRKDVYDFDTNTVKDYGSTLEKGNKIRRFPIFGMVKEPLLKYINDTHMVQSDYLFFNERDHKRNKNTSYFQNLFKQIANKAGYTGPEIHVHACRHSVARNLLETGNSMEDIGKYLGHSNPATTAKFYANLSIKETVDRMNMTSLGGENNKNTYKPQVPMFENKDKKYKKKDKLSKLANIEINGKSSKVQKLEDLLENAKKESK